jgi:hypothetical protein
VSLSDPCDAALLAEWATAQGKLGAPFSQARRPDIQPIPPPGDQAYIQELQQEAWVQERLAPYPNATFQVVEIDPLLAFQFHILDGHSNNHSSTLKLGPSIADLLPICLPKAEPSDENIRVAAASFRDKRAWRSTCSAVIGLRKIRVVAHGLLAGCLTRSGD